MVADTAKGALIRRRLLYSTAANYLGQIVTLVTGFFLTPFVLHYLGATRYGLWALVGSVVAYGTLLDFGINGAIIKYVAEYRARGETEQARKLIATALCLYTVLGLVVALLSAVIAPIFPDLFNVPPEDRATATWLVLLSGLGVGASIPCTTPVAVLRGLHRFDLVNLIGVTGTLLVTAATVITLRLGGDVLGMAVVNLPIMVLMQAPSIWLIKRVAPDLGFGFRGASRQFVRTVISFSFSVFITQMSGQLQTKTDEIVIGAFLPVTAVTPYAIARRLSEIARLLTNQFMKVLLPLASELHAENDDGRLRALYIISTRLTLAIFLPVGGTITILAGPILTAWVGPAYAGYGHLVLILTIASLIDTSQWPAGSVLQGMARHQVLAAMSVVGALANLGLSIALVRGVGLTGVALGTLVPTTIVCLGLILPYAMRVIGVSFAEGFREMIVPAVLPAVPMVIVLSALQRAVDLSSPLGLLAVAGSGVLVYTIGYLSFGASEVEREAYRSVALSTIRFARARIGRM